MRRLITVWSMVASLVSGAQELQQNVQQAVAAGVRAMRSGKPAEAKIAFEQALRQAPRVTPKRIT